MIISNIGQEIIPNNELIDFKTQLITDGPSFYHTHRYFECFYITSGHVKHYFNGKTEDLHAGTLYIIKPGDIHNFLGSDTSYTHRDIMFSTTLWEHVCAFLHFNVLDRLLLTNQRIELSFEKIKEFEMMFSNFHEEERVTKSITDNPYVYMILTEIVKSFLTPMPMRQASETPPPWLIDLVNKLSLPENLFRDKRYTLSQFHYSQEHICRVFKTYMKQTVTDYVNNKRIDHAVIMLYSSNKTVEDICYECGYESFPYFSKLFKEKFNVSPSAFRRNIQKQKK